MRYEVSYTVVSHGKIIIEAATPDDAADILQLMEDADVLANCHYHGAEASYVIDAPHPLEEIAKAAR